MTTSRDQGERSKAGGSPFDVGMEQFSPAARRWFRGAFAGPTGAQVQAWQTIGSGHNALVVAPTGSGKTLAAFLWALDNLARESQSRGDLSEEESGGVKVLYVSPLKALGVDVERNLRAPLAGLREASRALGEKAPSISVGVRSGDTTPSERRRLIAHPPDILITTPESLYLMLTSKGAQTLRTVRTVIVDEVHALAGSKRGAHLALSLERLDQLVGTPVQRIGLSATVEPVAEVARFLGGARPVEVVKPKADKTFDIHVEVPVADMTDPPTPEPDMINANSNPAEYRLGSMWPAIEQALYQRVIAARSTIVFTNSRRQAERLTARLNEIHAQTQDGEPLPEGEVLARAHHGSVSKEARARVEEDLKAGVLRCVVATASLELGIDMGDVDLVAQIDPPPSVSSGLQRLGRSGHQVGGASTAIFYPTHRSKLLEMAVLVQRMKAGQIEALRIVNNPLDVLAQQTIAEVVSGPLDVEQWYATVRRAAPFQDLPRSAYIAVLDLIAGKYPSTEFAALRARVDWDRTSNVLTPRPGALRLAVTNGGTIPDRGLYRVVAGSAEEGGTRVGELDEEMVYETRVGEVFTLGTTSWRVRQITKDTVEVEPAFGVVARTPFWRGDSPSRPLEVGRAIADLTSAVAASLRVEPGDRGRSNAAGSEKAIRTELAAVGLDEFAIDNTIAYVREQVEAVGQLPTHHTVVVERTRDDVGDWLFVMESPLGLSVHAPWALAISARLRDRWGLDTKAIPSNDGIIVRLPDFDSTDEQEWSPPLPRPELPNWQSDYGPPRQETAPSTMPSAQEVFAFDPDEIAEVVRGEVENSAIFASRFREAAARSLILGSSKPGKRSPLWQQRLRASALLEVASKYPDFPVVLEALREVLQDVYDVEALEEVMRGLARRESRMVEVTSPSPSPFARSLLFGYVGEFMYAGDVPLGERRIAALSVDPQVLRELLGELPLAELLEAAAVDEVDAELQRTKPGWQVRGSDGLVDLLRMLGPQTRDELRYKVADPDSEEGTEPAAVTALVDRLVGEAVHSRRVVPVRIGGVEFLAAIEDLGLLVAGAGMVAPPGVPAAYLEQPDSPVHSILLRHLGSNIPFTAKQVAKRFGMALETVELALRSLEGSGEALSGLFLPEESARARGIAPDDTQWVGKRVLDRLRTKSLALLRGAVEPVSAEVFAQFLSQWQFCDQRLGGIDGLYTCLEQLEGVALPASAWETLVLPQRIHDYDPSMLDTLVANGEFSWVGVGSIGSHDGWVAFVPPGMPQVLAPDLEAQRSPLEEAVLAELGERGALFAAPLREGLVRRGFEISASKLADAIWTLVWEGLVTSDSVAALRAQTRGRKASQKAPRARPRSRSVTRMRLAPNHGLAPTFGAPEPNLVGRWSLVTEGETPTDTAASRAGVSAAEQERLALGAVQLLERYGVVTRGSVASTDFPGGFAQAYRLYSDFEVNGTCRRGYFVRGLGGAQFAVPGAVDQLRAVEEATQRAEADHQAVCLAATDPANPYGAALSWPQSLSASGTPKRNPGAVVTILDGLAVFYLERGGRTALADEVLSAELRLVAARSLVETFRRGDLATFTLERLNGAPVRESDWASALLESGMSEVPRGLTLRRRIH